ncbi:hypothetical protein [Pseudochryseolinea flava]|uniref:Uncharacterized protein n=1 Tax=Pseudochryseolinea flava TaxID=2059302 RepID=A0A364Y6E5_9BACT|nr:hypothetical protein [Pseudochryseolinea flava]RAW01977.1 hypothetical protein DQQ10_05305 [Pseudochryseolinea flava]
MTQKIVPHQKAFSRVKKFGDWGNAILAVTTIVAVSSIVFDDQLKGYGLTDKVNALNSLLILAYLVLDLTTSYVLQKAEMLRRLVFIDNSFGVNLTGKKSAGYFTNESLTPGVYKMAVNCFENSFFSHFISSRMFIRLAIKNIPIAAIFIGAASMGEAKIVNLIFQLSLPVVLVQQLVKLGFYVSTTETVLDNFKTLFSDLRGNPPTDQRTPEILRNVIQYETNISWGSIPLSSSLFEKFNDELSKEWERMKNEYQIPNQ